ncbi:PKD domain-containing protein [Flavobacteriales bacterium]|nr:PKD domain-containing protein [Flavobacteriales bacterium]
MKKLSILFIILCCSWLSYGQNCSVSIAPSPQSMASLWVVSPSGSAPYSYLWSNGSTSSAVGGWSSPVVEGSTYCVTVTDASNCSAVDCYTVPFCSTFYLSPIDDSVSLAFSGFEQLAGWVWGGTSPYTYLWSDGSTADTLAMLGLTPGATYCLTITDANACTLTDCYTYNCGAQIIADADSLHAESYPNTGAPSTYLWNDSSTNQWIYNPIPNNTYSVTITDANGCVSSDSYTVPDTCQVLFSYNVLSGTTVSFDAYPTGLAPFTYQWNMSDGTTINTAFNSVSHTFTQGTGSDWAAVYVTDATGCVAHYVNYIQLPTSSNFCDAGFWATFNDNDPNATPGETFFHDWSTSSGNIVSWDWDLGNGQTSSAQNPTGYYTTAGYYTVCLTITDDNGCTDSYCQTCYIDPSWWVNSPWTNTGNCTANFIPTQNVNLPGMIYLVDLSSGNNLSYAWDFGNGVIINNQYPVVTFTSFGDINVCLTVTDTLTGCTDQHCDTLSIDSQGYLGKLSNFGISVIPTPMPASGVTTVKETMQNGAFGFNLYPNPAGSFANLEIRLPKAAPVAIELTDVTGKIISRTIVEMQEGDNSYTVNTENLSNGTYFVQVNSGGEINATNRLFVNH